MLTQASSSIRVVRSDIQISPLGLFFKERSPGIPSKVCIEIGVLRHSGTNFLLGFERSAGVDWADFTFSGQSPMVGTKSTGAVPWVNLLFAGRARYFREAQLESSG